MHILEGNLSFVTQIIILLLLYQQISRNKISLKWFVLTPLVIRILFFIVPPVAYFLGFLFPLIFSLKFNAYKNRLLDIFYGLYPAIVEGLFNRIISFFIFPIFGISPRTIESNFILDFIVLLLIIPFYYVITKSLKLDFQNLQKGFEKKYLNRFLLVIDISMVIYFVLLQILVIFRDKITSSIVFREYLVVVYVILFLIMLVYLNSSFTEKLESEMILQKDYQLKELEKYSHHVESLYQEIRSFRHDYINILTSIRTGLELRDIDAIQQVYDTVLEESGKKLTTQKYDITRLANLKESAIKSILSAKIVEAQNKGISISVEISENMTISLMEHLDFITVLSILCDNAIEAAVECEYPQMSIALLKDDNKELLIVENSTQEKQVDISKIFERGYSSKGDNRGLGLANVKEILDRYPRATLKTTSNNFQFSHIIELF